MSDAPLSPLSSLPSMWGIFDGAQVPQDPLPLVSLEVLTPEQIKSLTWEYEDQAKRLDGNVIRLIVDHLCGPEPIQAWWLINKANLSNDHVQNIWHQFIQRPTSKEVFRHGVNVLLAHAQTQKQPLSVCWFNPFHSTMAPDIALHVLLRSAQDQLPDVCDAVLDMYWQGGHPRSEVKNNAFADLFSRVGTKNAFKIGNTQHLIKHLLDLPPQWACFVLSRVACHKGLLEAWPFAFPFSKGAPSLLLKKEQEVTQTIMYGHLPIDHFIDQCLVDGKQLVGHLVDHPLGRAWVLKRLYEHPQLAFSFLNNLPKHTRQKVMLDLLPDLQAWRNKEGHNILHLWFSVHVTKSLALRLCTKYKSLFEHQDHQGVDVFSVLPPLIQMSVEKRWLLSAVASDAKTQATKPTKKPRLL